MSEKYKILGDLAKSQCFHQPINLSARSLEWAQSVLRDMLLIRKVEEEIASLYINGDIKTPIHLAIGQEAVAVGVSCNLNNSDRVFSGHRSHAHYIALGAPVDKLMSELMGKATGASAGMGGSMHLFAPEVGFHGSVPIVGATIPIAVGAGMACSMDKSKSVAVCYFGDGACEEGVLHESLNLAKVMNLPVLFVCENNLYSSHLDINLRQPSDSVARFADAHLVPAKVVDGNDVVAVADASAELIANARDGNGPGFLEAVTFRWRGHVGPEEDVDVGVQRSITELTEWKKRDPIGRLTDSLETRDPELSSKLEVYNAEITKIISDAVNYAKISEDAETSAIIDYVYG